MGTKQTGGNISFSEMYESLKASPLAESLKWKKVDPGRRGNVEGQLMAGDETTITPTDDGKFELVVDGDYVGIYPTVKKAKLAAM
jgi:hypothetical protein